MGKKILLIYSHDFTEQKSGDQKRFYKLIEYFKDRNYDVDQIGLLNLESKWDEISLLRIKKLVTHLYLFDFSERKKKNKQTLYKRVLKKVRKTFNLEKTKQKKIFCLPDRTTNDMINEARKLISDNKYDYVLFGDIFFHRIITCLNDLSFTKILIAEDFITKQMYDSKQLDLSNIGVLINQEILQINQYDHVIFISQQEYNFFSQFVTKVHTHFIPYFTERNMFLNADKIVYDLLFIGFSNIHNIKGLNWFLENVYPLLTTTIKIIIVGTVVQRIERNKYSRIEFVEYYKNIDELYTKVKITISPLFTGTGLKIKIIESLSYGKPVVCTEFSLNGFPSLEDNGCVIANNKTDFAIAINKLLSDPYFYSEQVKNINAIYDKYFGKDTNYRKLDRIFMPENDDNNTNTIDMRKRNI